ncbi:hypothetical protein AB0N05_14705 [Nocardia sp. NPDC051030]|uniref:hypothetical protein n=1 Tax=Nocardia sp. NPDC051030 TaxID=3155162 RepID=UPI003417D428
MNKTMRRRTAGMAGLVAAAAATLTIISPSAAFAEPLSVTEPEVTTVAPDEVVADPVCSAITQDIDLSSLCNDVHHHRPHSGSGR